MKKNLIYAMTLAAIVAGCSNDNDNPAIPDNQGDRVAIDLSTAAPTIIATRGTGSVGSMATDIENNKWSDNPIFISAYPRDVTDYSKATALISNKLATAHADNTIAWDGGETYYFENKGAFDFFGYHVDDATVSGPVIEVSRAYLNVTINGTQDLMIAKAELTDAQKDILRSKKYDPTENDANEFAKAFSAYTARRDVQPVMSFKHLLSRLKFQIYPGKSMSQTVYVDEIKVTSRKTGKLVFIAKQDNDRGFTEIDVSTTKFALMEKSTGKNLQALTKKKYTPATYETGKEALKQTPVAVGADMMVIPGETSYDIDILLTQYDDKGNVVKTNDYYSTTLETADKTAFKAGYSYDVKIVIYGLQPVEITTSLTGWNDGGEIPLDPDNEF